MGGACIGGSQQERLQQQLRVAAKTDDVVLAKRVIRAKAQVNEHDPLTRRTPLHVAACEGSTEVAQELVKHRAALTGEAAKDGFGNTPLHLALSRAQPHHRTAVKLVELRAAVDLPNAHGKSPMHVAAQQNLLEVVQRFLEAKAAIDTPDGEGDTPLHDASRDCSLMVVQELVKQRAPIAAENKRKKLPIHLAAEWGHFPIVGVLIESKAPLTSVDDGGNTPLHGAARSGHAQVVDCLVQAGVRADLVNGRQQTPLHLAAMEGQAMVVRALGRAGWVVEAQDQQGNTPLHFASRHGHVTVVEEMARARMLSPVQNQLLRTAVHEAAGSGHASVVELLARAGLSLNMQDKDRNSPMHDAVRTRDGQDVVGELLRKAAAANLQDAAGQTPLAVAVSCGRTAAVKQLLQSQVQLELADAAGNTPLHLAAAGSHVAITRLLLDAGASVNRANSAGESPYNIAVRRGLTAVIDAMTGGARVIQPQSPTVMAAAVPQQILQTPAAAIPPPLSPAVATGAPAIVPAVASPQAMQVSSPSATAMPPLIGQQSPMAGTRTAGQQDPLLTILSEPLSPAQAAASTTAASLSDREALRSLLGGAMSSKAWASSQGTQPQGPPPSPLSGQAAPLNAAGFAGVVAASNPEDMVVFMRRLVESQGFEVKDMQTMRLFAANQIAQARGKLSDTPQMKIVYAHLIAQLRSDAQEPSGWLIPAMRKSAAPTSLGPVAGQAAPPVEALARAAQLGSYAEAEAFVRQLAASLGYTQSASPTAQQHLERLAADALREARAWSHDAGQLRTIQSNLASRLQEEARTTGAWVQQNPAPLAASNLSPAGGIALSGVARPLPPVIEQPNSSQALQTRGDAISMLDPRGHAGRVGIIAFYHAGRDEAWDTLCGGRFLSNSYDMGRGALALEAPRQRGAVLQFANAEAAFQALKCWDRAREFQDASGADALQLQRKYAGHQDWSFSGFGNKWKGMLAVLRAKFRRPSALSQALAQTGDGFLLQHCPHEGLDNMWSDNANGEGTNLLGMQLLLIRDELGGSGTWTRFIFQDCQIDPEEGTSRSTTGRERWQHAVRSACQAVRQRFR
mmetsp:Transcript_7440/g.16414  ORF Transcript_7440/g.16414 Transcript_7440/m.16414 type:complete len:1079 (-) Transcript_7440:84-3320(-)